MKVEGQHTIDAPQQRVWALLNDPEVLRRATPGVKSLEPLGGDRFKATLELALGPVRGTYEGQISIIDKTEPERLTLVVEGRGRPGTVKASGTLNLEPQDGRTLVRYTGDAEVTGILMSVGHRLFGGVAKQMAGQFFTALQREIEQAAKA